MNTWIPVGNSNLWLRKTRQSWDVGEDRYVVEQKGKTHYECKHVTYHGNIKGAMTELLDRKAKQKPTKDLKAIIQAYQEAHKWVRDSARGWEL